MASVARTAIAAAPLPSGRARRLGFGRLSLMALPGRGAVVLTGRRDGPGRGAVLSVVLKAPARLVKAMCANPGSDREGMADDDNLDFEALKDHATMYKNLGQMLETHPSVLYLPPPPQALLSEEEKATQDKLKGIAERCIVLLADSMICLNPVQLRALYPRVQVVYSTLARVALAAKEGRANPGMAVLVAETLDMIRRMVSFACTTPLPLQGLGAVRLYPCHGLVYGLESDTIKEDFEVAWIAVLENLYKSVDSDISSMLAARR